MSDVTDKTPTSENDTATTQDNAQAQPQAQAPNNTGDQSADQGNVTDALLGLKDLGILNDVQVKLTIEVGRAQIKIRDLLNLTKDSIIDLNKAPGDPVDIYANGKLISRGHIITANGKYCVRLTSLPESSNE